jgi:hypothetical protein
MRSSVIIALFVFSASVIAGEPTATRSFGRDLQSMSFDTVTAQATVLVVQPEHQDKFMNGLFSLAVPGAGQYRTERYTKAAIFFGAEVALIAYAVISNANGDTKTEEFQKYAEAHWSAERYALWIMNHGADYQDLTKTNSPGNVTLDLNKVRQNDFSEINAWESAPHSGGFSHSLPAFRHQQYYELIGKYYQFKFGWDTYPNAGGIPASDGGDYFNNFAAEKQVKNYAAERGKANDYYYAASFAFSALLINHALSAVDAFFSTASYNNEVTAEMRVVPVDGVEGKRLLSQVKISVGL